MRMNVTLPPLDFLPTIAQCRQRDFRRQWRVWACVAACGALGSLAPIARDFALKREAQAQLATMRLAIAKREGETTAFDLSTRQLAALEAHRRAAIALIERRQPVAYQLLDLMRACADGVRLAGVKTAEAQLRIEGYATTQSRVRETQKRLRALPWVRKVAEVESSVVPQSVRRQLVGADDAGVPNLRRFALRIDLKPVVVASVSTFDRDIETSPREEVPDVR